MFSFLHLHSPILFEAVRGWGLAAVFAITHARVSHCRVCRTSVRLDDAFRLTRHGLMHEECVRYLRSAPARHGWVRPGW
jgi:hypothetical protein